jgi:lipid-A-disaccharide synthase
MQDQPGLLFSAFEPSGDMLAAETIATLRQSRPDLPIYGLGGPRMEAAGAELLEHTTQHGTMFLDTLRQGWSHHKRLKRVRQWLGEHRLTGLVPVDSPAANWSICRTVRDTQPDAKIIHLVAPQIWAWAPWRIRRLRRLTDHVLCLLPFEQPWLTDRGVRATFVGHPAFDPPTDAPVNGDQLPAGSPRLALLPGSRRSEIARNWPTMARAFLELSGRHDRLEGVIGALDAQKAAQIREVTTQTLGADWPDRLTLTTGRAEAVMDWCDAALVASGTVTLQVTARLKPMVVIYNMNRGTAVIAACVIATRTFTLPNLVSEWAGLGRAVPELVPHFGQVAPVVREVERILIDDDAARTQVQALTEVAARFGHRHFAEDAPREVLASL